MFVTVVGVCFSPGFRPDGIFSTILVYPTVDLRSRKLKWRSGGPGPRDAAPQQCEKVNRAAAVVDNFRKQR